MKISDVTMEDKKICELRFFLGGRIICSIWYIFTITLNNENFISEKNKLTDDKKLVNKDEKFLGLKFSKEMKQLKKELNACNHHYVRCLKSNELKKPYFSFKFCF